MKKILALLLVCSLAIGLLAGCAKTGEEKEDTSTSKVTEKAPEKEKEEPKKEETKKEEKKEEAPKAADPITMKIGHSQPTETPRHQSLLKFKEMVEEKSNKSILVEIYPSAQLGNESEMIEQVKMGTLQGVRAGVFDAVAPELLIYTMPFLFEDIESFQAVAAGPIGEAIGKNAEKNGIKVLATGDAGGFRNITNNTRPVTKPEDLEGLKMRTPPVESIIKTMEALGANPVSIPYVEVYMGLKTGLADGQENPFVNIATMKFHEVQKYCTVVNYQVHPDPFNVNLEWFNSLSAEHQKLLKECATEMMKISDQMMTDANVESFDLIKNSLEIYELTDEERQVFIDKVQPVYDYYIEQGLFTMEDIEAIRNNK